MSDLAILRQKANNRILAAQNYNESYYNSKHAEAPKFEIGNYVVISNIDVTPGINKKLLPKYKVPYVVKKVLANDRYVIGDIEGFQITQRPFEGIFDSGHMKLWGNDQSQDMSTY